MSFAWIIFILVALLSYAVQYNLRNKFERYSHELLASGLSGAEVAQKMLQENGIYDVTVTATPGSLTDHYNPTNKTVNLSDEVYNGRSVASAAVAAHECGHAIQHARAYAPLTLRSALVPVVSFTSQWMHWVLLAGILLVQIVPTILLVGIVLFSLTTLFSFVTLPAEIDASRRAVNWIQSAGIVTPQEYPGAVDALRSAAYTYVIAALSSLATLIYYIMEYAGATRRG